MSPREAPFVDIDALETATATLPAPPVAVHRFPHTYRVLLKRNSRVGDDDPGQPQPGWRERLDEDFLSNTVFGALNRVAAARPGIVPRLNRVSARVLGAKEYTDTSWRVFCTSRDVRFRESEYAVPRASLPAVVGSATASTPTVASPTTT